MAKGTFGEILKREREMREVTLNEVTVATRIPPRFLEAFEREDWEKLPGGAFNRGFVRAIARYLGLNEESLLSEYDLAYGEQKTVGPPSIKNPIPSPPKLVLVLAAIFILLVAGGVIAGGSYGWRSYAAHRVAKHAAATPATAQPQAAAPLPNLNVDPAASTSAAVLSPSMTPGSASAALPQLNLSVSTSDVTRVRVVADGKTVLNAKLPAGETRHLSARTQFQIYAARPAAVLLQMNGQTMPQLGSGGSSGTIVLGQKDLRQAPSGNTQP
jgi:cytoskeleton protein RodZ